MTQETTTNPLVHLIDGLLRFIEERGSEPKAQEERTNDHQPS